MPEEFRPPSCPSCGSDDVAAIMYGLPDFSPELEESLERGEIRLGGCCVFDEAPVWTCNACSHSWGRLVPLDRENDSVDP
jgi:hypothetical protein